MKNYKINTKLFIGFGIILTLMIVLGVSSFIGIWGIKNTVDQYSTKTVPNIKYIWHIRSDLESVQRYLLTAIVVTDEEEQKRAIGDTIAECQSLSESIQQFRANSRTDPKLLEAFETKLNSAVPIRDKIIEMLNSNIQGEKNTQVIKIFQEEYTPIYDESQALLAKVSDAVDILEQNQEGVAERASWGARTFIFVTLVMALVLSVIVIIQIKRSILIPLNEIKNCALEMAKGNLGIKIQYKSRDEFGELAQAMNRSTATLSGYIADIARATGQMATGNFDVYPTHPFIGDFKKIEDSINEMIMHISSALSQIGDFAGQVSSGSEQVSASAQALAQGAVAQAGSVQELSAAVTEISNQVKRNVEHAREATEKSSEAAASIENSNEQMKQLIISIRNVDAKSQEIQKIISVIQDIAFQTNILSLNAAVEAARAGSAGKGFVVVADEVRNLASKSAEAVKNTTSLIGSSIAAIREGVRYTELTAENLNNAVESVVSGNQLIGQISKSSNEQSEAIDHIITGLNQISSVVETNSAASEESAASSEELSGQANLLKQLMENFKIKKGT